MFEPLMWALLRLPMRSLQPALLHDSHASQPAARPSAKRNTMELRVDVQWSAGKVDEELRSLHARLDRSGLLKNGTRFAPTRLADLVFHHREADGEHYIYVVDKARSCLAGYTVFNRLIEINRTLDRWVRAPHSKYADGYQRRGIATEVYGWALGQGFCLISGARQSPGAHALWQSLARRHQLEYVEIRDRCIRFLGPHVDLATQDCLQTRLLLLGAGRDVGADAFLDVQRLSARSGEARIRFSS